MALFRGDQEEEQSNESVEQILLSILTAINAGSESGDTSLLNKEATQEAIQICLDFIKSNTDDLSLDTKVLQVDSVGNVTYIGYAEPGADVGVAEWAIKKIEEAGQDVSITWADGDSSLNNIWDDRLILTYV